MTAGRGLEGAGRAPAFGGASGAFGSCENAQASPLRQEPLPASPTRLKTSVTGWRAAHGSQNRAAERRSHRRGG